MDLNKELTNILETAKSEIISNIQKSGISASGRTERSIQVVERSGHLLLLKEAGDNAPISTLETGRGSGKVPSSFNQIILQWLKDKGVSVKLVPYKTNRPHKYSEQERSERLAAGAIAHTIATQGTGRYAQPRNDIYSPVVEKAVNELKTKISDLFITAIQTNK